VPDDTQLVRSPRVYVSGSIGLVMTSNRPPSTAAAPARLGSVLILGFVGFVTAFGAHIVVMNLPVYADQVGVRGHRHRVADRDLRPCGNRRQTTVQDAGGSEGHEAEDARGHRRLHAGLWAL